MMNEKMKKIAHEIGIQLLKFIHNKKKICMFFMVNDKIENDHFQVLCNLHTQTMYGNVMIDEDNSFFSDKTNLNTIYHGYNAIIVIDCVRYADNYDVKVNFDKKIMKITYYTKDVFTYENLNTLLLDYGYGIYDFVKDETGELQKVIKPEYKYLL